MTSRRRLAWWLGLLVPLCVFTALALSVRQGGPLPFDVPLLEALHGLAGPRMDVAMLWTSHLGYSHGVVPAGLLSSAWLLARRRWREGAYVLVAFAGALWINALLKGVFVRPRPDLWEPVLRYSGFSFPSGHAMASATLAVVWGLLAWRTRWRVPWIAVMVPFAGLVGMSRPYLGVHYPSDVLGGWAAACFWSVACYLVAFRGSTPWRKPAPGSR